MKQRQVVVSVAQILVSLGIMGWLIYFMGTAPFVAALGVLTPLSITAALGIGTLATIIQAQRWRLLAQGFTIELRRAEAIGKCWQAAFLNSILPGGLVGDAVRAVEQRIAPHGTWRGSLGSVVSERFTGTMVTVAAAGLLLIAQLPWVSLIAIILALVIAVLVWPAMRRIPPRARWAVLALAIAGWVVYVLLFLVATLSGSQQLTQDFVHDVSTLELFALISVILASMSIPLSWAGWGPREGTAAIVFPLFGFSAQAGVTVVLSYGILALVSVLPGAGVMLFRMVFNKRQRV